MIRMDKGILEELMPFVTERLGRTFERDKEYKQAIAKENEIYEQLKQGLTTQKEEQLAEYFMAVKTTEGICEKLSYQQGVRDMILFYASILGYSGEKTDL